MVRLTELASIVLGILLAFSFAPYEIFPLAIIAPAGLLALLLHATPKRAAWLGFLFGLGMFSAGVYWVFISIHEYGDVPNILATLITAGLIGILALFPAVTCYLTNRYYPVNNTAKLVYAFPAMWLLSEWIRSWVGCGFPWLFLGYSQNMSFLKGYAPILSVYGVSLAVLMSAGLLVKMILAYKEKNFRHITLAFFSFAVLWIIGGALSLIVWTKPEGKPITVSLVQGNIPQSLKWSPEHINLSFDRYIQLTESQWTKSDLIVWPEAAIPVSLQNVADFIERLDEKAQAYHTELILGIPIQSTQSENFYNAIISLGKDKRTYLKRRLVPYGEYVPFQQLSSRVLSFMNVPMSNTLVGNYNQKPLLVGDTKINSSICFEIAFPELINMRDKTIGLLLTVTNDAWFGHSSAQSQHLQMAKMRALELARPVLFVSNDGITAIIDSRGNLQSAAPPRIPYVLQGMVQPRVGLTPWMTNGIDPILFILICFLFVAKRSVYSPSFTRRTKPTMPPKIDTTLQREHDGRTIQTTRN